MQKEPSDIYALRFLLQYASDQAHEDNQIVLVKILEAAIAEADRVITWTHGTDLSVRN